jgi:hypothetical protein
MFCDKCSISFFEDIQIKEKLKILERDSLIYEASRSNRSQSNAEDLSLSREALRDAVINWVKKAPTPSKSEPGARIIDPLGTGE